MTRADILRGKRPLPEWDSGAPHKRPSRANENIDALCHEQVEANDSHLLVALRHASHERCR